MDILVLCWYHTQFPNPCSEPVSSTISKMRNCLEVAAIIGSFSVPPQNVGMLYMVQKESINAMRHGICRYIVLPFDKTDLKWMAIDNPTVLFHMVSNCQCLTGRHSARAYSWSGYRRSAPLTDVKSSRQPNMLYLLSVSFLEKKLVSSGHPSSAAGQHLCQ